jgi:hypothetical protein
VTAPPSPHQPCVYAARSPRAQSPPSSALQRDVPQATRCSSTEGTATASAPRTPQARVRAWEMIGSTPSARFGALARTWAHSSHVRAHGCCRAPRAPTHQTACPWVAASAGQARARTRRPLKVRPLGRPSLEALRRGFCCGSSCGFCCGSSCRAGSGRSAHNATSAHNAALITLRS